MSLIMLKLLNRFFRNDEGGTLIEFTLIFMLLIFTTFAVTDIGYALWQWNSAEKATQLGARKAVVSYPVATGLEKFDCTDATVSAGDPCTNSGKSFGTVTCYGNNPTTCSDGSVFRTVVADLILARMQLVFPRVQMENLEFIYEDLRLAFAGRGSPVASVTVRMVGLDFQFILIEIFAGLGTISMPDYRATLSTEDLDSTG